MKTTRILIPIQSMFFLLPLLGQPLAADEPRNPAIRYDRFVQLTQEVEPLRERSRVSEESFLRMATERGTIILDARSKDKYDALHIKGAIHLAFSDFTEEALAKVIPNKTTRILIYCNNNFENEPVNFASKFAEVALNIQTFINLHAYGYRNIHELAPLLDVNTTRIPFEGTAVKG